MGKFVLVNTYLMQLYQPLNFLGFVYREIKQATIDIEMMFEILGRHPEIEDRPGAQPADGQPDRAPPLYDHPDEMAAADGGDGPAGADRSMA